MKMDKILGLFPDNHVYLTVLWGQVKATSLTSQVNATNVQWGPAFTLKIALEYLWVVCHSLCSLKPDVIIGPFVNIPAEIILQELS
jgi:hypothetical protein